LKKYSPKTGDFIVDAFYFMRRPIEIAERIASFYKAKGYKADISKEGILTAVDNDDEMYWISIMSWGCVSCQVHICESPLKDFRNELRKLKL
jgi:hypothetical protein